MYPIAIKWCIINPFGQAENKKMTILETAILQQNDPALAVYGLKSITDAYQLFLNLFLIFCVVLALRAAL